jgi:hypothetical protein
MLWNLHHTTLEAKFKTFVEKLRAPKRRLPKEISGKDSTLRLRLGGKLTERSRSQRVFCLTEIA